MGWPSLAAPPRRCSRTSTSARSWRPSAPPRRSRAPRSRAAPASPSPRSRSPSSRCSRPAWCGGRPSYGAVFFEPVPEAALVLGIDVGARFLRGALCDLDGEVRARQDAERAGADAQAVLAQIEALHAALLETADLPAERVNLVVV